MGKINNKSAVEIIPISKESYNRNKQNSVSLNNSFFKMSRMPYLADRSIVPRVRKYLENNVDKTYVDINVMADELQQTYREYARLKRNAFRTSVKKAYAIVLQNFSGEDQDTTDEEDESDGSTPEPSNFHNNTLNSHLVQIYSTPKQIDENELIDISSDDSEAVVQTYNDEKPPAHSSNGASTSSLHKHHQHLPPPLHELPPPPPEIRQQQQQHKSHNHKSQTAASVSKKRKIESSFSQTPMQTSSNVFKKKKSLAVLQEPSVCFKDIGGMDRVLEDICKLLIHVKHPEVYKQIGVSPPRGFLLHGPPGCGKTLLANAIAGEIGVPLLKVAAPELVAGVSGESEERIRELFERASFSSPCILFIDEIDAITPNRQNAQKEMERRIVAQLLSCLDDLSQNESGDRVLVIGATNRPDAIDPALRRAGRFDREICLGIPDIQSRIQILKILTSKLKLVEGFDYESLARYTPGFVGADLMSLTREAAMVAVNRMFNELKEKQKHAKLSICSEPQEAKETDLVNKSDPEIIVDDIEPPKEPIPVQSSTDLTSDNSIEVIDVESKTQSVISDNVNGHETIPSQELIAVTVSEEKPEEIEPVPEKTQLEELLSWLHDRVPLSSEELATLCITMEDFGKALKCVQPSAKREGFATVPDVTWEDVGSLNLIREELQMAILAPIKHAKQFTELGMNTPTGVMLCGPPGCGKTLLAKAIANEAGINFISVKGPELLNMYVGESERAVRVCFERARNSAPCVIFFDELDAICPKRSDSREGGATMRVVNQMLTEMDGVQDRKGVYLLAATNRPDIIDPAVLRPGRFDKILFVGLPTSTDRIDILTAITKNGTQPRLAPDVDLDVIGGSEQCDGYTGADLAALVREAGTVALKEFMLAGEVQQAEPLVVKMEHFTKAISKIRPSVPEKDQKHYEKLRKMYAAVPEQNDVEKMEYS